MLGIGACVGLGFFAFKSVVNEMDATKGRAELFFDQLQLGQLQAGYQSTTADFQAQQGNEFSLLKFHNDVLNHGMPPIRLLRELMLKDKSKWNDVL